MRSIALSETSPALSLCRRPSKWPAGVLSPVQGPHSWLLSVAPVAVRLNNSSSVGNHAWVCHKGVIRTTVAWSDRTFNKTREIRHHGVCIPLDTWPILYQPLPRGPASSCRNTEAILLQTATGPKSCPNIERYWDPASSPSCLDRQSSVTFSRPGSDCNLSLKTPLPQILHLRR